MEQNIAIIKERILQFVHFQKIKKVDFFQVIDISPSSFKGAGLKSEVSAGILVKVLQEYPEINPLWLLLGEQPMLRKEKKPASDSPPSFETKPGIPLIIIKAVEGFEFGKFASHIHTIKEHYFIPKFENRGIDFLIEVEGFAMNPKFNQGNVIGCKLEQDSSRIRWNEPYLISTTKGELLIKRIKQGEKTDQLCLVSDNKEYDSFNIPINEVKGLALILGTIM